MHSSCAIEDFAENHLCKLRVMLHHMLITWCGSFSGSRYYDVFENDTGFWWVGALGRPLQPDTKHSLVFRDLKLSFCCRPARVAKRLSAKHTIISQETGVLGRVKDSFGTKYTGVSMGAVSQGVKQRSPATSSNFARCTPSNRVRAARSMHAMYLVPVAGDT